ncbi:MAG: hypothetical protein D6772_07400, partial [Bacteroidetes bacterium]
MAIFFIVVFVLVWFAIVAGAAFTMPVMTHFFPGQEGLSVVGVINLLFTIGIPLLAVVLLITRVAFRRKIRSSWVVGLGAFWLLNAISLAGIGGTLAQDFVAEDSIIENVDISRSTQGVDTLQLFYYTPTNTSEQRFRFGGDHIQLPGAQVDVVVQKSTNGEWSLEKKVRARARTEYAARALAGTLTVPLRQSPGKLAVPREIPFGEMEKWRAQKITLTVHVPPGAFLRLNRDDVRAAYVAGPMAYDKLRAMEVYQMQENGRLQCLTCPTAETKTYEANSASESLSLLSAGGYEQLAISGPLRVTIEQGDEFDVRMNGPQEYLSRLEQQISEGELQLKLDAERSDRPLQVYLTIPSLRAIRLDGTDDVRLKNIQAEELSIEASSRSAIKLDGKIGLLRVRLEDLAELEFTGDAEHIHAELRDLSRLDADRGTVLTAELELKNQSRAKMSQDVQIQQQFISEDSRLR